MKQIVVKKGRTVMIPVSLGFDASNDSFTSQIRAEKNSESELIATWNVSFSTDGIDGELVLTLDDSVTRDITRTIGYMDLVRITGGEPIPVFDELLEVYFEDSISV